MKPKNKTPLYYLLFALMVFIFMALLNLVTHGNIDFAGAAITAVFAGVWLLVLDWLWRVCERRN